MIVVEGRLICASAAQAARVAAHLPEHARLSRAEPGCLRFDIAPDPADPLIWTLDEAFVDAAAFAAHRARSAASNWARASDGVARELRVSEAPD